MECDKVVQACHCACGPQAPELQMILPKKKISYQNRLKLSASSAEDTPHSGRYSPEFSSIQKLLILENNNWFLTKQFRSILWKLM